MKRSRIFWAIGAILAVVMAGAGISNAQAATSGTFYVFDGGVTHQIGTLTGTDSGFVYTDLAGHSVSGSGSFSTIDWGHIGRWQATGSNRAPYCSFNGIGPCRYHAYTAGGDYIQDVVISGNTWW